MKELLAVLLLVALPAGASDDSLVKELLAGRECNAAACEFHLDHAQGNAAEYNIYIAKDGSDVFTHDWRFRDGRALRGRNINLAFFPAQGCVGVNVMEPSSASSSDATIRAKDGAVSPGKVCK